jgi:ABC-type phosphate transport system substrate-binding protein
MNLYIAFLVLFVPTVVSQDTCGDAGTIYIAGSTTVEPIALAWAAGYQEKCPGTTVNVTGGGSTTGARKVCSLPSAGFPAEIGNLSREWRLGTEVNQTAPYKYKCVQGNQSRTVTQVEVAIDALAVILVKDGMVAKGIQEKGLKIAETNKGITENGLKIAIIRWIFSNWTEAQLIADGWNSSALANSDGNDNTHLWSEIDDTLPKVEIKLASLGPLSGPFSFFKETVLPGRFEGIATNRSGAPLFTGEDEIALVQYVATSSNELYGDAITYLGFAYYAEKGQLLYGVPIQPIAGGAYIEPTQQNVDNGRYTPLSRPLYMNFLDSALPSTAALLSYGFSPEGLARLNKTGYVQPTRNKINEGLVRVGRPGPPNPTQPTPPPYIGEIPISAPVRRLPPTEILPINPIDQIPLPIPAPSIYNPTKRCGLFGLSIFCPLTFCGALGRLLGLCRRR